MPCIKDAVQGIIGRRIAHIVLTTTPPDTVHTGLSHLYFVFTDGWYYELWSDRPILPATGTSPGTLRSILGRHIWKLRFLQCKRHPDWGDDYAASRLTITFSDGSSCGFYSDGVFHATSRLCNGGLIGALGYFPDDIVLLHVPAPFTDSSPVS
jgi:hypothetical protein